MKLYHVYLLASRARVLYIGITSNRIPTRRAQIAQISAVIHVAVQGDEACLCRGVHACCRRDHAWEADESVATIEEGCADRSDNPEWEDLASW